MILFQEFTDGFGASADGVCFPRRVHSAGLGLVEFGLGIVGIETDDQGRNTKGTYTTGLGVPLLDSGHVTSDVVDGDGVFDGETMGLAFHSCLVNEDSCIGGQTGKSETDVIVKHGSFTDGSWILKLKY